jgi:single-strand DNA-binding protein
MINKVLLIGNLGSDPDVRYTQAGTAVCSISLATTEKIKAKDGTWNDQTEWHRCVVWGKLAENCEKYLQKGSKIYMEGRLQTRKWTDQNGTEKYTTEIIAREIKFLSGFRQQENSTSGYGNGHDSGYQEPPSGGMTGPDDVPF